MDFPLIGSPSAMPAAGLVFAGVTDIKLVLIGGSPDLCAPDTLLSAEKSKPAGCLILRLKRTSLCASELLGLTQNRRRVHGLALGQT